MKAKLKEAMKAALKAKEQVRLQTIRSLLSEIQYEEMQKKVQELNDNALIAVLKSELKKRRESLEFAEKAEREDQIEQLKVEITTIEEFLPAQLSTEKLEQILSEWKDNNPDGNVGMAMKMLKEEYSGSYDGKTASEIARRLLS